MGLILSKFTTLFKRPLGRGDMRIPLVGLGGAGKSTILKQIGGVDKIIPTIGTTGPDASRLCLHFL